MGPPSKRFVTADELRRLFNSGEYWSRLQAGEFRAELRRNGHPTSPERGEPYCTRSQIVEYRDRVGLRIAVVHQYLRPDGSLGGSGRPDPKLLVEDGITYRVLEPERGGQS